MPGYRTYDLAKARALVRQLGGLSFNLFTLDVPTSVNLLEGLQTEYQQAGMKVTLSEYDLSSLIEAFLSRRWTIALQTAGSWDPASGVGIAFRFSSASPTSGVHSPRLDTLIDDAANATTYRRRQTFYNAAAAYIAKNALGPFLFGLDSNNVVVRGAGAPGLSTLLPTVSDTPQVLWQYAYNNNA